MDGLRESLRSLLVDFRQDGLECCGNFALPGDFLGFSGHFPGAPVLPGLCHVQCVLLVMSAAVGRELSLRHLRQVRFSQPVIPGQTLCVAGRMENHDGVGYDGCFNCRVGDVLASRVRLTATVLPGDE